MTVGPLAELLAGIEPLEKLCFDCVRDDALARAIAGAGKNTFVMAGIEAHVCVSQTCLDLVADGFRVVVVADAVSSRTPENHRFGLDRMRAAGAVIVSTEMLLFELLEQAGTDEFKQILALVK